MMRSVPPVAHTNGTLPRPATGTGRGGALPPHPRNGAHRAQPPPAAVGPGYSLPRASNGSGYGSAGSYGSYDRRIGYGGPGTLPGHHPAGSDFAPDHYFMPSQRKYSGEFLRVYVDYNK